MSHDATYNLEVLPVFDDAACPGSGAGSPGSPYEVECPGIRGQVRANGRRQRVDARQLRVGPDDDRSGIGLVLWWPGATEECPRHHDAKFRFDGCGDRLVGPGRL